MSAAPFKLQNPCNQPDPLVPPAFLQHLRVLRRELLVLAQNFEGFKDGVMASLREWLGRISALAYRQAKEKAVLDCELEKSKQLQHSMRNEVISLKEMINEAMAGYARDLHARDKQIQQLSTLLSQPQYLAQPEAQQQQQPKQPKLEVIQQEPEQNTFSAVTTLRENEKKAFEKAGQAADSNQDSPICSHQHSPIERNPYSPIVPQSFHLLPEADRAQKDSRGEAIANKSFPQNFRKTVNESMQKQQEISRKTTKQRSDSSQTLKIIQVAESVFVCNVPAGRKAAVSRPLQEISTNVVQNRAYLKCNQNEGKQSDLAFQRPKVTFNCTESRVLSSISDSRQPSRGENEQNAYFKAQHNLIHHSKLASKEHSRIWTEPSSNRARSSHSYQKNNYTNAAHLGKSSERPRSQEEQKSINNPVSKKKIRVVSRMMESNHPCRNPTSKAIVYLGGKSLFRKFLVELKEAFRNYTLFAGAIQDEVKYEGQKRNRMRWGRGRLFYRNGMVYEGEFRENMRHGRGSLYLNGISMYEGQWRQDQMQGQGYLKSMKYLAKKCPPVFNEASFCGNLSNGLLHGVGTIFLNQKEKIVTKFKAGMPMGELTYYNLHEIEFGVWSTQ